VALTLVWHKIKSRILKREVDARAHAELLDSIRQEL